MTMNLTTGKPALAITAFSVPLIIGNIFQQLYNMADAYVVEHTIGFESLAAVVGTGSLQFLILGFIIGTTSGAAIISAQRFGSGDERGVRRSFTASIVICFAVTFVLMLISITSLKSLLTLLNTPAEIYENTYRYFVVLLWGMPALTLFNVLSNIMRAAGDIRTPLYFLILACVINIILDYVFILAFKSGVTGAGLATVIAQLLSALACIPVINRKFPGLRLTKEDWVLYGAADFKEIAAHIKTALPVGFQWSIIAIGAVAVTFSLNGLGYEAVAAYNIGQRVDQFASMPLGSYGQAMTTYSAQNYGARKYARIRAGILQGGIIAFCFAVVTGVIFFLYGNYIAAVFLGKNPGAVALAHTYLKVLGCSFVFLALLFTFRQAIQGLGDALTPTISGVTELLMRTFAALILTKRFGYLGLCFAGPLAFLGALIPLTISLVFTIKKLRRLEQTLLTSAA